ncbi:MAG: hypothetical protein CR974_01220 [Gammaproteobacteria bacterium]|nr:MAG: hypothetical protein CR974_01220 [Gammaproteobacteria bacterium]
MKFKLGRTPLLPMLAVWVGIVPALAVAGMPMASKVPAMASLSQPEQPAIDANRYIALLGSGYQSAGVQALKQRFKAERPEMDYEDARAHWYFYDRAGVDFVFADATIFTDQEADDIGEGELFLTGMDFYRTNDGRQFDRVHQLPCGVRYGEDYDSLVAHLQQAGAEHKIRNPHGENGFALKRADGRRYALMFTLGDNSGVVSARIRLDHGQDHLAWLNH